jgi:hypothetical protein
MPIRSGRAELVQDAAALARKYLAPGGAFLVKVFHGGRFSTLLDDIKRGFRTVQVCKPGASRSESRETTCSRVGQDELAFRTIAPIGIDWWRVACGACKMVSLRGAKRGAST